MVGISEDSKLGVVIGQRRGDVAGDEEIVVFLRKVSFGDGAALALVLAVDSFLEPVGDESA